MDCTVSRASCSMVTAHRAVRGETSSIRAGTTTSILMKHSKNRTNCCQMRSNSSWGSCRPESTTNSYRQKETKWPIWPIFMMISRRPYRTWSYNLVTRPLDLLRTEKYATHMKQLVAVVSSDWIGAKQKLTSGRRGASWWSRRSCRKWCSRGGLRIRRKWYRSMFSSKCEKTPRKSSTCSS